MKSTYNPGVHKFSVFVVCWTVLLFIAGALVTSKEAALSVTDWPKSHGTWVPPLSMLQGGDFFEFSHRVFAGGLGILTLALAVLLWAKEKRPWLRWLGLVAVLGVAVQAILGGQVVIRLLHYWLPVIHACFAQIVFAAVLGIAVFTSKWWVSDRPQLEDSGTPSIQTVAMINVGVIFLQVVLGAGFRHSEIPVWPHIVGAFAVMASITWTAVALRKRFGNSAELSRARALLHAMFGLQFVLGFGAFWARLTSEKAGPTSLTVIVTVAHTVVGALLFAFSILVALICYRLVPRRREVAATAPNQVTAQ